MVGDEINMQKRILYVGNDIRYFLMHRLHLARAARDAGFDVQVALPKGDGTVKIVEDGITFHPIVLKRGGVKIFYDIVTISSLCRLYRSLKPDIIHHHTIKPVIYGGISARLTRQSKVVSAITGLGYAFIGSGIRARMLRSLATGAYRIALAHPQSRVIFQNSDDRAEFVDKAVIDIGFTRVIKGSGVDLTKYDVSGEPGGKPTVVMVSRMLWDKGVGEFVEASKLLISRGLEARFVLVGDVDKANPGTVSRKQLKTWHESGAVEWMGWVDDLESIYKEAHIVCLPSRYGEGVPRSLIEAAACGKPIVTTDSSGCREIVRNGDNGYLVPINDFKSLADALQQLLENPDLRCKMGARGRIIAESEFSSEEVIQKTLAVYEELLR